MDHVGGHVDQAGTERRGGRRDYPAAFDVDLFHFALPAAAVDRRGVEDRLRRQLSHRCRRLPRPPQIEVDRLAGRDRVGAAGESREDFEAPGPLGRPPTRTPSEITAAAGDQ